MNYEQASIKAETKSIEGIKNEEDCQSSLSPEDCRQIINLSDIYDAEQDRGFSAEGGTGVPVASVITSISSDTILSDRGLEAIRDLKIRDRK